MIVPEWSGCQARLEGGSEERGDKIRLGRKKVVSLDCTLEELHFEDEVSRSSCILSMPASIRPCDDSAASRRAFFLSRSVQTEGPPIRYGPLFWPVWSFTPPARWIGPSSFNLTAQTLASSLFFLCLSSHSVPLFCSCLGCWERVDHLNLT